MTPDDATLDLLLEDMIDLGFQTGTAAMNYAAAEIAWELAETAIGSNLLTGTACEQDVYPTGYLDDGIPFQMLQLEKTWLRSEPVVTVHHEEHDCDCGTVEVAGCVTVYNAKRSEVRVDGSCLSVCSCSGRPHPFMVEICYIAGVFDTYEDIPRSVLVALAGLAKWWMQVLEGGGDFASGFVTSWRSMDYNESLAFVEPTVLGSSPEANAAWLLLRKWRVKRALMHRGHYPRQFG